jgi:nifR3 family TIM-barrel protein
MREPKLLSEIINCVARAVRAPVTVKMRAGYDRSSPDCGFVARLAEDFGTKAVTIHPRRGSDQFRGEADWSLIARAKEAVGIPVIGNGDIDGPEAALRMIDETGCDAVMVGRAALGHPWVFRDIAAALNGGRVNGPLPERQEVGEVLLWHYRMSALSSPDDPVRRFRKFAAWYSRRFPGSARFRKWVNSVRTDAAFRAAVVDFFGVSEAQ